MVRFDCDAVMSSRMQAHLVCNRQSIAIRSRARTRQALPGEALRAALAEGGPAAAGADVAALPAASRRHRAHKAVAHCKTLGAGSQGGGARAREAPEAGE